MKWIQGDTIVALATPHGQGAIALIRLSGPQSHSIISGILYNRQLTKRLSPEHKPNYATFGVISYENTVIDEVMVTCFKAPKSYTGEDMVEVSCHGSGFIQQQLIRLFLVSGARIAQPGEFTLRAFLNGKLDLSQAEAVADLVDSNSQVSHQLAMQQMRGGFSNKIKLLRDNLLNFAALIELELDFSEEDVEFANRDQLKQLINTLLSVIDKLAGSFEIGNVIKTGIPVAIVGRPNAGKSTLMNALLDDERSIVSEIPGTTRDTIEDEINIDGIRFRFIDTAGLRNTSDVIEQIGVNRAFEAIKKSAIVVYLFDSHTLSSGDLAQELERLKQHSLNSQLLVAANKIDTENNDELLKEFGHIPGIIFISAREKRNIDELKKELVRLFDLRTVNVTDTVVTNARHAQSLKNAGNALRKVMSGIEQNTPGDILALDIRYALDELGSITGQVTNNEILENIFSRFCIGK